MQRNPHIPFTYQYSQPDEYHFSLDSIEMAWEVAQELKRRISEDDKKEIGKSFRNLKDRVQDWRALDLCAGCGVIGFEMNFHLPEIRNIEFVEVQEIYKPHFEANRAKVQNEGNFRFLSFNYERLSQSEEFRNRYDLIVCNPPYFKLDHGKLSPSEFKNRCRFFIDSTFEKLIHAIEASLAESGEAFMLLRDLEEHGCDLLSDLRELTRGKLHVENLTLVRGTFLLRLYRQAL